MNIMEEQQEISDLNNELVEKAMVKLEAAVKVGEEKVVKEACREVRRYLGLASDAEMMQAMQTCGCDLNNAYMQHSLLALVVIPELRISDLGLVDVRKFEKIDVLEPSVEETYRIFKRAEEPL